MRGKLKLVKITFKLLQFLCFASESEQNIQLVPVECRVPEDMLLLFQLNVVKYCTELRKLENSIREKSVANRPDVGTGYRTI